MTRPDLIRRRLIAGSALATLPMFRASPALAQVAKLSMGVGLAQEPGALMLKMQQDKLLEKAAQELGLAGVEVEYLNFPALLRMLQGIAAGQLQMGTLGSTPTIRSLAGPDPTVPLANGHDRAPPGRSTRSPAATPFSITASRSVSAVTVTARHCPLTETPATPSRQLMACRGTVSALDQAPRRTSTAADRSGVRVASAFCTENTARSVRTLSDMPGVATGASPSSRPL